MNIVVASFAQIFWRGDQGVGTGVGWGEEYSRSCKQTFSAGLFLISLSPCHTSHTRVLLQTCTLSGVQGEGKFLVHCGLRHRSLTKEWCSLEHSEMNVGLCFQAKQLCSRFRPATARWSCGGHCPPGESVPGGNLGTNPGPRLLDW